MSFDFSTLITDRSQADVEALRALLAVPLADWTAEQLAAFNQAKSKGAYNYTDLNRVTQAMDAINARLTALGYQTGYQRIVVPHQESGGSVLPEGYTQVAWIESTGSQYISGITIPSDFKISLTISAETTGAYMNIYDNHAASPMLWIDGNKVLEMNTVKSSYTLGVNKAEIVSDATGSENTLSVNGSIVQTLPKISGVDFPITLFNRDGGQCFVGRIYHLTIASSTSDLFDFVPCIDPGGSVGLYDLIEEKFYGNAGTGEFIAGPEVPPEPDPEPLDPYTWYEEDVPTESTMKTYLANVSALRTVLTLPETTAEAPENMNGLTMEEANAIEEILATIEAYLLAMSRIFLRSGMAWGVSGGPGFYFSN